MEHTITRIDAGSVAQRAGITAGSRLVAIDSKPVLDVIDYEALCAAERLTLTLRGADDALMDIPIHKPVYQPLGLNFESGLMSKIRSCKNHCLFCFIDQMPRGIRRSLNFKDDDWRLSLIMGNYVTLTNTDDAEFARIIERRVSPLYISVHATDPDMRVKLMRNPTAGNIMQRLSALKASGLKFHAQVVLCPGYNDGGILEKTIDDIASLYPSALSLAIVPVGLTEHREGLEPLRTLTRSEARSTIEYIESKQQELLNSLGTRLVFAADEMYIEAGLELPPYESCEGFDQLENGVGMFRSFESELEFALEEQSPLERGVTLCSASGTAIAPHMAKLFDKLRDYGVTINVNAVRNAFLGECVTVSGLVTAGDIADQLNGKPLGSALLIPHTMLRESSDVFLDGHTLSWLEQQLGIPVRPVCANDGERFIKELFKICNNVRRNNKCQSL